MVDPTFPTPEHQKEAAQISRYPADRGPRKHRLIPNHAVETMNAWDEHRAREQARYAAMTPAQRTAAFTSCIQDFPTPERMASLPDLDARDRAEAKARADAQAWAALPWWRK